MTGNLFAVGVESADPDIRIGDEAIVMRKGKVEAVGVAMMSGEEMADSAKGRGGSDKAQEKIGLVHFRPSFLSSSIHFLMGTTFAHLWHFGI